jgi:glycolate oxidase iron-sulfur subunit
VQYGKLIEPFRVDVARLEQAGQVLGVADSRPPWWLRLLLFHVLPYRRRARLALLPARILRMSGLDRLLEWKGLSWAVPSSLRELLAMLPGNLRQGRPLPEVLPPMGELRARVALFTGCVADVLFRDVHRMTAWVLQRNGCEVWVPRRQVCCGALAYHAGRDRPAIEFALRNLEVFLQSDKPLDAIIVNVAGCGSMLKDYHHLLSEAVPRSDGKGITDRRLLQAAEFAAKVRDVHEFLSDLGPVPPRRPVNLTATYHDACHLCHAQKIRSQPRQLLAMVPGLELRPLAESEVCCGAAGSYNLTQPDMAQRLGDRKAQHILATGAEAVVTGNAGCLLQIRKHLQRARASLWVGHPIEVLWYSYQDEQLPLPWQKPDAADRLR